MEFRLTPEQQRLENEVLEYMQTKMPPGLEEELEVDIEGRGPICKQFLRQLGSDGWLGIGWPKEYGGQGRSPIEQYIFFDLTLGYYFIPLRTLTINAIGPTIMQAGTPEQKKRYLPGILHGELVIAIGYTEPEAGSDVASLQTKAVRDGDDYVINGQKVFTSQADFADFIWLAARTDPEAPKHKGISLFMVDVKTPGITINPMPTMSDFTTNSTFFDDVRVPKECLIGEENQGWMYMNHQLALERIAMVPHSSPRRFLEILIEWVRNANMTGDPVIRYKLAEMAIETEIVKLLNYRVAWLLAQGQNPHVESAMIKVFGSEQGNRILSDALEMMGLFGQLQSGSKWVPSRGTLERWRRVHVHSTFGGGANEVLRDAISTYGLGLPRMR